MNLSLLSLFLLARTCIGLFPGAEPDEGDIRHIYPFLYIGIGLENHAHAVPYLFGWLENLDYPKERTRVELFIGSKEDATIHQVKWWMDSTKTHFKHVEIFEESENWLESALRSARLKKASRCLLLSADDVLTDNLFNEPKHIVVSPLLWSIDGSYNNEDVSNELKDRKIVREQTSTFSLPLAIDISATDSSYLTFDGQNLPFYEGPDDPEMVFTASANNMNITFWIDNQKDYGIYVNPALELDERRNTIRYHLADFLADDRSLPIVSRSVRPWFPEPSKHGVDRIYLINLKRRTERLKRMQKIFELLGIEFTVLEATDGQKLDQLPDELRNYRILDGYMDPFHKRPIKNGEIGCFLSHFRIWQDVVKNKLEKVIVFEDDLRFAHNGMERIREVLEDLRISKKPWDLIYLGRKKQSEKEELWIAEHRHLSSVEYSYWTLGYLLSLDGAKKLLETEPLKRIVPVDEYLPIMFDKHPNQEWSSNFPNKNLNAFTLYPLVVFPQKYTTDAGYVSDTEDSLIIQTGVSKNEEL